MMTGQELVLGNNSLIDEGLAALVNELVNNSGLLRELHLDMSQNKDEYVSQMFYAAQIQCWRS